MTIETLMKILGKYNKDLRIDVIHFDENAECELCVDVYDNETGESFIRFFGKEDFDNA